MDFTSEIHVLGLDDSSQYLEGTLGNFAKRRIQQACSWYWPLIKDAFLFGEGLEAMNAMISAHSALAYAAERQVLLRNVPERIVYRYAP